MAAVAWKSTARASGMAVESFPQGRKDSGNYSGPGGQPDLTLEQQA
jgi:hypothetical protein